jgi:4-carboxymuconolactone decarboxylase
MSDTDDHGYLPDVYRRFRAEQPEVWSAYASLAEACRMAGRLSLRDERLVKLGIAVGLSSAGGVRSHVRRGLAEGLTGQDLLGAILLAIPSAGFPASIAAYQWALEVLDAAAAGERDAAQAE